MCGLHEMVTKQALCVAWAAAATVCASEVKNASASSDRRWPRLLGTVENALLTTAKSDFGGSSAALEAAAAWNGERLQVSYDEGDHARAPHLCCADYGRGREAYSRLQELLSPEAVRPVAHSEEHGACFFATASHADAETVLDELDRFGVRGFAPFPSALKIAPGVLEHSKESSSDGQSGRLGARHGALMRKDSVVGLNIELAPGTLPAHSLEARSFILELLGDLMSASIDLHATNFWSDPAMAEGEHLASPGGASRAQDWSKAAAVVHELSEAARISPGNVCSWDSVISHHAGDDLLIMSGMYHVRLIQNVFPAVSRAMSFFFTLNERSADILRIPHIALWFFVKAPSTNVQRTTGCIFSRSRPSPVLGKGRGGNEPGRGSTGVARRLFYGSRLLLGQPLRGPSSRPEEQSGPPERVRTSEHPERHDNRHAVDGRWLGRNWPGHPGTL